MVMVVCAVVLLCCLLCAAAFCAKGYVATQLQALVSLFILYTCLPIYCCVGCVMPLMPLAMLIILTMLMLMLKLMLMCRRHLSLHPTRQNPAYFEVEDTEPYRMAPITGLAVEIWTVDGVS